VKITSQMVKELRDKTNAGMMDCKKALGETGPAGPPVKVWSKRISMPGVNLAS
jgi:hypothetical protein